MFELERREETEAALLEAHELIGASLGPGHERTVAQVHSPTALYEAWGRPEKAAE